MTAVSGSAIQVSANVTPPANGGFEVRRRDWAFGPGTNSDLVLRSPVANFTIPREAVRERYYIRMYDGSTPPIIRDFRARYSSTSHCRGGDRQGDGERRMTDFEAQVLADLSVLKNQMGTLLGDGNSGRIAAIEGRVGRHEQSLQRAKGFAVATGAVIHAGSVRCAVPSPKIGSSKAIG